MGLIETTWRSLSALSYVNSRVWAIDGAAEPTQNASSQQTASGCLGSSKESAMNLNLSIGPLVSLLAGILILIVPRMLNYIVAIYLIVMGVLGLFGTGGMHLR